MIWIAVTIPLVGFTLMAFSKPKETLKETMDNTVRLIEQPLYEVLKPESPDMENTTPAAESTKTAPTESPQPTAHGVEPGDIVKGCVKDPNGQPLEYANLVEEDEYHRIVAHAISDKNGNFSLKVVNPNHKIRISYVGFISKTIEISDNQIDVVMEPNLIITDVKVVGRADSVDLDNPRYKEQDLPNDNGTGFDMVEQAPVFPGGMGGIFDYLNRHLCYPSVAREMRVEAEIVVRFTVDKTGFVRSPQVVNANSHTTLVTAETMKAAKDGNEDAVEASKNYYDAVEALKEEAIHVVRNMPRWEPGRQNGKRVNASFTLPISFKLN